MEKVLIQVYIEKDKRDYIRKAAVLKDRSLSSYIRLSMMDRAYKDTGIEYKEGR